MKFALILFTFCIFGCGGSASDVNIPAEAIKPTTVTNTTTTNTDSGNTTTTTDNSVNGSYNNYTGGK